MKRMKAGKGQISTELLVLIGLMLSLLLPLLLYSYSRANVAKDDLSVQKAEFAAQRLSSLSNSVGYLGGAAAIIEEIEFPANARSLRVNGGRDIVVDIATSSGIRQIVQTSDFELESVGLEGVTSQGTYFIEVRAVTNFSQATQKVRLTLK